MKTTNEEKPFTYSILALSANKEPLGSQAKILAVNPNTGEVATFLDLDGQTPDGIGVDDKNKRVYWTHMGKLTSGENADDNDGSISSVNFDGSGQRVIIPAGKTFTPKQLTLDVANNFIYWSDREGMRVMRSALDGSNITVLVQTGSGEEDRKDATKHCVGIAADAAAGFIYWTEKGPAKGGVGRILRAAIDLPVGETAQNRTDIEVLYEKLPEPIDLEIDGVNGYLYWTDRGAGPLGNTLNRAKLASIGKSKPEVIGSGHQEIIGLAIAPDHDAVFTADLGGTIRRFDLLTGSGSVVYKGSPMLTGIAIL